MSDTQIKLWFHQGLSHHRQGDLAQAEQLYLKVINADPMQVEVHYLLGTLYLQDGKTDSAINSLMLAQQQGLKSADLCNNLGIAMQSRQQFQKAGDLFRQALEINSSYHQARYNLAVNLIKMLAHSEAIIELEILLKVEPENEQLFLLLGECHLVNQKFREALKSFQKIQSATPEILFKQAFCYARLEENKHAANLYQQYLLDDPEHYEAWINLSYVAERAGLLELAVSAAEAGLKLKKDAPQGWNNLGVALRSSHLLKESLNAFETGLKYSPASPLLKFNLATTSMLTGDYQAGWNGYEERIHLVSKPAVQLSSSRWNGSSVRGKRLLITVDQGLGDTIQFSRFLPLIQKKSNMQLFLACQNTLIDFMQHSFPEVKVCDENETLPDHDLHFPLMSIGRLWNLGIDEVKTNSPYLSVSPSILQEIGDKLETLAAKKARKIGLVWRGNPVQARDIVRSMPLSEMSPLFSIPDIVWYSLNIDAVSKSEIHELNFENLFDLSRLIHSLSDTAALLHNMDLLITVDTSIAHLAGALGIKTWTLLCHTPDWRWHLERSDSPWYPSMKLFRQSEFGNWETVIGDIKKHLQS